MSQLQRLVICVSLLVLFFLVGLVTPSRPGHRRENKRSARISTPPTSSPNDLNSSLSSIFPNDTYFNDNGEICNAELPLTTEPSATTTASDSGLLPRCRKLEIGDIKKHSLLMIKQEILRKLRLDENRLPNISAAGFPIPPAYLSEFIHDYQADAPSGELDDDEHASTEKIIAFAKIGQRRVNGQPVHQFSFSDKLGNMRIDGASLHVHVRFAASAAGSLRPYGIRLTELVSVNKGEPAVSNVVGIFKPSSHSFGSSTPTRHHRQLTKWVQVDVKSALVAWMSQKKFGSSKKISVLIEAVDGNGKPLTDVNLESSNAKEADNVNNYPFIEVQVSEGGKSRPPRNLGMSCDEHSQEDRCCRYPLTVDFEDFGWDWIIAPKKYDANYCSGKCPYAFLQKYPHNHIVQQANPSGVGGPCCAARKMSSISMLYFNSDSEIVFSVLPGMVVDRCGCN